MTYQEFVSGPVAQQRYWARSHLGWTRMKGAEPNAGHHALAAIDPDLLITQNVDGLHERAGSPRVVALHGRIADVICLSCREVTARARLHERLDALNPGFGEDQLDLEVRPDGDVVLEQTDAFVLAPCEACGGTAQARRRLLRRERAEAPGRALLRRPSTTWPHVAARCWSPARAWP